MKRKVNTLALLSGAAVLLVPGLIMGFTGVTATRPARGAMKPSPFVLGPIIFVSNRLGIISGTPNGNDLWTMNADGTNAVPLTDNDWAEYEPQWDPYGTKIAFTSNQTGNWDIYTMNPDGTGVFNVTNNSSNDFGASWSPDGTQIAFASDRDNPGSGIRQIYVVSADGSTPPVRLTSLGDCGGPAWYGTKIAYSSVRNGNEDIYVKNADGTGSETRLTSHVASDHSPCWSPDGAKIAFTSTRTGTSDIYSMNASNGSGLKRLTSSNAEEYEPAWSPDGTKIVYFRKHDVENHEIYIMGSDGKQQVRLTNNFIYLDADPSWKPLPF